MGATAPLIRRLETELSAAERQLEQQRQTRARLIRALSRGIREHQALLDALRKEGELLAALRVGTGRVEGRPGAPRWLRPPGISKYWGLVAAGFAYLGFLAGKVWEIQHLLGH